MPTSIATGFDVEPQHDGNSRIEFQDDDGKRFNSQIMACQAFNHIPVVAHLTQCSWRSDFPAIKDVNDHVLKTKDSQEPNNTPTMQECFRSQRGL